MRALNFAFTPSQQIEIRGLQQKGRQAGALKCPCNLPSQRSENAKVLLSCVAGPLVGMHIEQREMASYWMHKNGVTYRDVARASQLPIPVKLAHVQMPCRHQPSHPMRIRTQAFWTSRSLGRIHLYCSHRHKLNEHRWDFLAL